MSVVHGMVKFVECGSMADAQIQTDTDAQSKIRMKTTATEARERTAN